jgi:hypothetical protein
MGWESRWGMVSMLIECLPTSDSSMLPLTARQSSNSIFLSVPANADDNSHEPPNAIRVRRVGPPNH